MLAPRVSDICGTGGDAAREARQSCRSICVAGSQHQCRDADEPPAALYAPRHLILPFATLSDFAHIGIGIALARTRHRTRHRARSLSASRSLALSITLALARDRTRTCTTMSRDTTYTQSSWYAYGRHVIVLHVIVFGRNGFPSE